MELFEELKELHALNKRKYEIFSKIQSDLKDRVTAFRHFQDGEIVEAYHDDGKFIGRGIVQGASILGIGITNEFELNQYISKPERWEKELTNIRYKVFALKKDGTQSQRLLDGRRTYGTEVTRYAPYIKKTTTT